jgi:hypothetical protein
MQATAERKVMARGRPKKSERVDATVKIDKAVATMAKAIADYEGSSVASVLSEAARPLVEKKYAAMLRKIESAG